MRQILALSEVPEQQNHNAQMALQNLRNNCLTCARPMEADFLSVEDEDNTTIADVLMKHFWFTKDDLLGMTICRICWDQVNHFHQFYILVEEVYQSRVVSLIVKSEQLVTDHDSLEEHMSETSAHELAVENPKEESLISVPDEPTFNVVELPSDENDQMPECKQCRKPFDHSRKLDRHMKEQHATKKEEKKFKCERCPRSFAELRNAPTNSFSSQARTKTKNLDESNPVTCEYEQDDAMQQKESTVVVKEEPDLESADTNGTDCIQSTELCLEEDGPENSKCELNDTHQPLDSTLVVKEESALDVGFENGANFVQSRTENNPEKFQKRRKWYRKHQNDIIRTHVNLNCKQCDVVSETFAQYFRHSMEAHNVELQTIECCGKLYSTKDRLSDHVQLVNNPDIYRCKLCEKNFHYKYGHERHMKRVHRNKTEKEFKCDQCPRAFTFLKQYNNHVKWHADLRVQYPCFECPSIFYLGRALENHVASAHPGNQISSYQPLAVSKSDDLEESQPEPEPELKPETRIEQHECSSIVKIEPALEIVDDYMQASTEEEAPQQTGRRKPAPYEHKTAKQIQKDDDYIREHVKFICKWCGEDSPNFALYVKHSLDAHANKSAGIECCGKKYYRKDRIYQHVQVVNNPDTYRCARCQKKFEYKQAMILHMNRVHKVGGQFKCDQCPQTFYYRSGFASHTKTHLTRYPCTDCERAFSTNRILELHYKAVHTGVSARTVKKECRSSRPN